nr:MAG TPA: hypothetical protein [Caudoviricetes sp.]
MINQLKRVGEKSFVVRIINKVVCRICINGASSYNLLTASH